MKGAVLFGRRDARYVDRDDSKVIEPTDAIIRLSATCVCGSHMSPRQLDNALGLARPAVPAALARDC